jgi:hypothetical protein
MELITIITDFVACAVCFVLGYIIAWRRAKKDFWVQRVANLRQKIDAMHERHIKEQTLEDQKVHDEGL